MDATNVIPVTIEEEMKGSYLDYAMSVIIGRALPDVRDGLKPVHRRILYAMLREGLTSGKKFSKCAGVVGEVLKKYHPHGDSAVYNSLVRMAQPWNLRYPLIEGQGNFGSVDGDSPAAYRYTECRMFQLAESLLEDIDKDTVGFVPNFDDSTDEPGVLPSRVPNLLVNGAEGIAVGMASSIPPHNLTEVINATIKTIEDPDVSVRDLMDLVPGPDFPTAGIIYGDQPIRKIYETGRGLLKLRAKLHIETIGSEKRERQAIVVDEIPYQVNKAKLIEKIAELVNTKKIEGVSKLRDESDRRGMRIVIELKRDADSEVVTNQLYKLTPMQRTYGTIMLAIVDGQPRVLSLRELLDEFVRHRRNVVTRRCRFELGKAEARLHILEGYRIALDQIDEVIKTIRSSDTTAIAKERLQANFSFSEIQAQHILDMPLKRLTGLERKAIDEEFAQLSELIANLKKILGDPKEIDRVIVEELVVIRDKFGDERRTVIEEGGDEIELEDLIVEEDMMVTISHRGYAKRCSPTLYKAQRRGGKGVRGTKKLAEGSEDFVTNLFVASTHAYLLVFTTSGKLHWLKVYNLPEMGRAARGRAIVNMVRLDENERVSAILPVRHFEEGRYVVLATRNGYIKRVDLMAFSNVRQSGIRATVLDEGDELIGAELTDGARDIIISSRAGLSIRFHEDMVRAMGRSARGVRAIKLEGEDNSVVSLVTVARDHLEDGSEEKSAEQEDEEKRQVALLTVCENGYGKRTKVSEYRAQGRGGKGVIDIKANDRNGPVVAAARVEEGEEVMLITSTGNVIRMPIDGISVIGRNTQGVRLVNLGDDERVAAAAIVADSNKQEEEDFSQEETPQESSEEK